MKIIYAGTPPFAATALGALADSGHEIALVLTQPDRPAGRGMQPQMSAVKRVAAARGFRVEQPPSLRSPDVEKMLSEVTADVMVVAAYGLLLPPRVLAIPPRGCLNIHASLLPRWRGAAPIQRAILAGDAETGVAIMQMDEGLDTGAVRLSHAIAITAEDTASSLHDRLAELGAALVVRVLAEWPPAVPQASEGITYAAKISKAEALIDWSLTAEAIDRQIRAFNPVPGAYTEMNGQVVKIWKCRLAGQVRGEPGAITGTGDALVVTAGDGRGVELVEVQRAGGKRMDARAFQAGHRIPPGTRLG